MAEPQAKLDAFPVFMRVRGRACVIVGGGAEAFAKARLLAQSSAGLVVVAPALEADFAAWLRRQPDVRHVAQAFAPHHLDGATLVFAAMGEEGADRTVVEAARAAR